jgi:hypothetical protein
VSSLAKRDPRLLPVWLLRRHRLTGPNDHLLRSCALASLIPFPNHGCSRRDDEDSAAARLGGATTYSDDLEMEEIQRALFQAPTTQAIAPDLIAAAAGFYWAGG